MTVTSTLDTAQAEKAATALESLVRRLTMDDAFAAAVKANPREALSAAGLVLEKEAMESLMVVDPDRFDRACDALFDVVDSDFLLTMVAPSCG